MKIIVQKAKPADLEILKDGRPFKLKFYENASNRLALGKTKTGGADTGLTKEDEAYYEDKLGLGKGELSPKSEFWYSFHIMVTGAGTQLDTEDPMEELKYKVFSKRPDIATSTDEAVRNPKVKYIMMSEDFEAESKVEQRSHKKKAYALLSTMTEEDMRNYLLAANKRPQGMSQVVVERYVTDDVELNPKRFLEIAEDPHKDSKIFINELVMYGFLRKNSSAFVDSEGTTLGYSMGDMVGWMNSKENNTLIISLKKQLITKKNKK